MGFDCIHAAFVVHDHMVIVIEGRWPLAAFHYDEIRICTYSTSSLNQHVIILMYIITIMYQPLPIIIILLLMLHTSPTLLISVAVQFSLVPRSILMQLSSIARAWG